MAEKRKTYPSIPTKNWWALRDQFKRRIPTAVTRGYIASTLNMSEESARANILPALVTFGIVDQDWKPTERANGWRLDEQYTQVCQEIRREVYPQELIDSFPGPVVDITAVERWFMTKTGVGVDAAKKMAGVYAILTVADPSKADDDIKKGGPQTRKPKEKPAQSQAKPQPAPLSDALERSQEAIPSTSPSFVASDFSPTLHLDIQVHISPDASADQIDQIFSSMAKHLFKRT